MSVSVELSNLGPLRAAELELADLTLLIGDNNTGKTFFATVLHRVLNPAPFWPAWRHRREEDVPSEVEDWITSVLDAQREDPSALDGIGFAPSKATITWARAITSQALRDYGASVRHSIAYAFGAESSRLRRRTPSRHAADCYLRISSSIPDWRLEIRFDSEGITVEPPDAEEWLKSIQSPEHIQRLIRPFSHLRRPSSLWMSDILGLYPGRVPSSALAGVFASWPRRAFHLPADRTGIMQSHNVLAGAAVRQSATAGIRPIEIETLPGTSADFLSLILEIPETLPIAGNQQPKFAALVRKFEQEMRAEIAVDQRSDGLDAIMAVTSEGRFPMARASSMLSELAPLLLLLKSPLNVDHLTIDEPEAHLHPEMQVRVASFLAKLVNEGMQIVLTTHSDFFVSQFNNMMRHHELSERSDITLSSNLPTLDRSKVQALRFSRENSWCVARDSVPDPINGVDESTFTDVMRSQYDETAKLVNGLLEVSRT
ncbi:MAG: AAA family ATPase [bacterium]|nr:AAA family ATPase [bacterium]